MDTDYLSKVLTLANVATPMEQPTSLDWRGLETTLGIEFPGDYKALMSNLGSGRFGDLVLRNPRSPSRYLCLNAPAIVDTIKSFEWAARKESIPLFPQRRGFLPIGSTGFGRLLLVEVSSAETVPDQLCWFDLDLYRGKFLTMSVCQFLHDLYLNLIGEQWAIEERGIIWEQVGGQQEPFFRPVSETYGRNITCLNRPISPDLSDLDLA